MEVSEILNNLKNLEPSFSDEIKMALMFRAGGYMTRNVNQSNEYGSHFYYEKYGKYTNLIGFGKLKVPSDLTRQCLFFFFFFFF